MDRLVLTKSDFLDFCACAKSLWLRKHKPDAIAWPVPTAFDRLLMKDGQAVEEQAKALVGAWEDANSCSFQRVFETPDGLYARADIVRGNGDGTIDLWEIKASTSLKSSTSDHVLDAGFQVVVAERGGAPVQNVGVIHVNTDYVRNGPVDPAGLLVLSDVTKDVRQRLPEIRLQVDTALALLGQSTIDETSCDCLFKARAQHCASFGHFNPDVPSPSIYDLPRISGARLENLVNEGRFGLDQIEIDEVTASQKPVLLALRSGTPSIKVSGIKAFCDGLEFPLYFYDYETYGSAIPLVDGHRPHEQIPVQVSLHKLQANGALQHSECLIETPGTQADIVAFLRSEIGTSGNLISWNASFENSCNERLERLCPDDAEFLTGLKARTKDLMDVFKADFVHPDFRGSTSIKKVLPVLVPTLQYDQDSVHDGAGAIEAWYTMVHSADFEEKAQLRQALLDYCRLDTLAMVEIYRALRAIPGVAQ